jgi:prepilin-type N-terminal cleavage/methylation domain-containing protein
MTAISLLFMEIDNPSWLGTGVARIPFEFDCTCRPAGRSLHFSGGGYSVRNSKGFTLIELLIVVVIIGILAAIAIPKFANTKEKAYIAAMKSDLRNMVTAQESYFADGVTYTANLGTSYSSSAGVTVAIGSVTGTGWAATATHNGTAKTCQIYVGVAVIAGQNEGEPKCS